MQLDHVTIRTSQLEKTRDFFIAVFDLMEKPRPKIIQPIPGHWLYHEDEPIVHIIIGHKAEVNPFENKIDHVGFKLKGYDDFKHRLEKLGIAYSLMDIAEIKERRVFFHTPDNLLLEGVFKAEF